jgi:hypothetical protein
MKIHITGPTMVPGALKDALDRFINEMDGLNKNPEQSKEGWVPLNGHNASENVKLVTED